MSSGGSASEDINENSMEELGIFSQSLMNEAKQSKLYTDPKSPFQKAPQIVKDILTKFKDRNECINTDDFNLNDLTFDRKQGDNHYCMHVFERDQQQFYFCYECTQEYQKVGQIVWCKTCFILQDHAGHHYYKQISRSNLGFCDCGSYYKLKPNVKCKMHGQDRHIQISIPKQQQSYFIAVFKSLIDVACYLNLNNQILEKVYLKLSSLISRSPYYSKLILNLLKSQSQYFDTQMSEQKSSYILFIFGINQDTSDLVIQIIGNRELKTDLALFLLQKHEFIKSSDGYSQFVHDSSLNLIFDIDLLLKFSQQGKYYQKIYSRYKSAGNQYLRGVKLYQKFIKYCIDENKFDFKKLKECEYIDFILIITDELAWDILKMVIQLYQIPKKKKKKGKGKKNIRIEQQPDPQIKYANQLIMRCILTITEANRNQIQNFREKLLVKKISIQKFQQVLEQIAFYCQRYLFGKDEQFQQQTPVSVVSLLLLFKKSPNKQTLIQNFWLSIFGGNSGLEYIIANIYEIVSDIILLNIHFPFYQLAVTQGKMVEDGLGKPILSAKIPKSAEKQQILSKVLIKFLSRKQIISRDQIFEMKKGHILNFNSAGKIIKNSCSYNQDDQAYYYIGAKLSDQFEDKFSYCPKQSKVPDIISQIFANTYIHFGFSQNLIINKQIKQLLSIVLSSKVLQEVLQEIYKVFLSKRKVNDEKIGYLYLFTLILIDGFTNSTSKKIHEKLQNIKENKKLMQDYAKAQGELEIIYRLFELSLEDIDKKQNEAKNHSQNKNNNHDKVVQINQEEQQQKKRKYEQKKRKIHQKFQQKRNAALDRIKSKTLDGNLQDQDVCLTCHQKSKPDNQLVYLSKIGRNNSICQAVHGQNQKSNTTFYTCFHTMHVKCFIEMQKSRRKISFDCPLCNVNINSFVPRQLDSKKKEINKIFQNILIASMVFQYKAYDVQNYYLLFFKSLVLSKGLSSLINGSQNWQKHKLTDKSDSFIYRILMEVYDEASQHKKLSILEDINLFIQELKKCKDKGCGLVQILISSALKSKISNNPHNQDITENMNELYKILKKDEYYIIKQQVQKILLQDLQIINQKQIQMPQNSKISLQFTLKQLPRDSTKFKQFEMKNSCSKKHDTKMDFYCLICGQGICDACNDNTSQLDHCGVSAYLSLEDYTVHFKNSNVDNEGQVYLNDYHVSYNQRGDYEMEEEIYTLDILKLSSMIQEFMQN